MLRMCTSTTRSSPKKSKPHTCSSSWRREQNTPGSPRQGREQIELERAERDVPVIPLHLTSVDIDDETVEDQSIRALASLGTRGTAQHRLDAGDQLAWPERLGHVVVGTHRQTDQGVELLGSGREQDHGNLRGGPQPAQHLDPVGSRHHHVEHDEVRRAVSDRFQCRFAVARLGDVEPFALEVAPNDLPDLVFVIDHENSSCHSGQSTPTASGTEAASRILHGRRARAFMRFLFSDLYEDRTLKRSGTTDHEEPTMERKAAVAAASAVSMSLAALAIGIGASFGALGFGTSATPAPAPTNAAVATAPAPTPTPTSSRGTGEQEHEDQLASALPTSSASHEQGYPSDD